MTESEVIRYYTVNDFLITNCFEYTHCLMYKKLNLFVYELVLNCLFFPNSTSRLGPIKFKMDMLYHIDNNFQHVVF